MTPADFIATHQRLGISRGELCRRIGIAPNSGTAYAKGRQAIPLTVERACRDLEREFTEEMRCLRIDQKQRLKSASQQ